MSVPAAKPRSQQAPTTAQAGQAEAPASETFAFDQAFGSDALTAMAVQPLPGDEATEGGSAPDDSDPATSNPDGGEPSEQPQGTVQPQEEANASDGADGTAAAAQQPSSDAPVGRRAKKEQANAAAIQSFEEQLQQARAEWEAERKRADEATQLLAQRQAEDQAALQQVSDRIGPQAEFERLSQMPSTQLTYEQQQDLDRWKEERLLIKPRIEAAQRLVANGLRYEAMQVCQLPGIDSSTVADTSGDMAFSRLCTYFYETGKGQAEEASKERIAELEAELDDLKTRTPAAAARPLARGGASTAAAPPTNNGPVFDPTHTAEWNLQQAFPMPQRRG